MTALIAVRVAAKTSEAEGVAGFRLEPLAAGDTLPGFEAGAHVEVQLRRADGSTLARTYSLCNAPPPAGQPATHYELGVLHEPGSRGGSQAMHEQVQPDDALHISAPRNLFPLAAQAPHHLLLAGGIGVTPLLAMAEALWAAGQAFTLHHAARCTARLPYRARLAASAYATQVHQHLDDGPPAQRLDLAAALAAAPAGSHLYVCGPQGFMDAVLAAARAQGWSADRLHWESFGAAVSPQAGDGGFELQIGQGGRVIPVAADQSALQALLAAGVSVMSSCEQGVCGTCLTRVLDGEPEHRDQYLTPEEQAANDQFMPCCSRARSARLVLDL